MQWVVRTKLVAFFSILLNTCKRRGPGDPGQHDPEDIRADRRQPEEPFQFTHERKDQQDHRKISTGHVLKKEPRPSSLQWSAPRTLLTEGQGPGHQPEGEAAPDARCSRQ